MVEKVQYKVNDVVRMKKKHPCGSDTWTILRVGMDFGHNLFFLSMYPYISA